MRVGESVRGDGRITAGGLKAATKILRQTKTASKEKRREGGFRSSLRKLRDRQRQFLRIVGASRAARRVFVKIASFVSNEANQTDVFCWSSVQNNPTEPRKMS